MAKKSTRLPKTDSRFWTSKVFRRGSGYSIRFQHAGKEVWLALGKSIKEDAAQEAAQFFKRVEAIGLDEAMAERKPRKFKATVAGLIEAAKGLNVVRPETIVAYEVSFRRVVAEALGVQATVKTKFSPKGLWKEKTDTISLDRLSKDSVQAWADRTERKRSPETVRKLLREAAAIWKMVAVRKMDIDLPASPFVGLRLPKRVSARYKSKIKAGELLKKAMDELPRPELTTVILALCAGMRRREIDALTWASVFPDRIEVAPSEEYALKSEESAGAVPLDPVVGKMLAAWKAECLPSAYVVRCDEPARKVGRTLYRSAHVQEKVVAWLRENGVATNCPIHTLRKECGSLVAALAGVYAASAFLRHKDVQVTQSHYIERKAKFSPGFATVIPIEQGKEASA